MKNYLKTTFVLVLVALFAFSACSKDDGVRGGDDVRRVSLKLTQEMADEVSRAVGPHVDATKAVVFNTGYIYFTNASGGITKTITIISGVKVYDGATVGIETLTTEGIVVENVDAGSTKVHIAGNITVTGTPTNISDVMATVITVESQYDDDIASSAKGGVDKVALYGVGPIEAGSGTHTGSGKTYDFKAKVEIGAMNSRLEIGKFTASGEISGYTIEGIFINNNYIKLNFDGTVINATDKKDNGKDNTKYIEGVGSYTASLKEIIYDYSTTGLGEKELLVTWADSQKDIDKAVWGYNFLVANPVVNPQIAIRIKDVVLKNGDATTYAGTQFISIRTFYTAVGGAEDLVMAKGNVYRITDLNFDEGDLRTNPFEDSKRVLVEATLMNWVSTDIGYELD